MSPENWSGRLEVSSALDGTVRNNGVARYAGLDDMHLVPLRADRNDDDVISLVVETNQSRIRIAEAARTRFRRNGEPISPSPVTLERPGFIALQYGLDVTAGDELTVEKIVAVFTSRDQGISEAGEEAEDWASNVAGDFERPAGTTRRELAAHLGSHSGRARHRSSHRPRPAPASVPHGPDGVEQLRR